MKFESQDVLAILHTLTLPEPQGNWTDEYFGDMTSETFFRKHIPDNVAEQSDFITDWLGQCMLREASNASISQLPHMHVVGNMLKQFLAIRRDGGLDIYKLEAYMLGVYRGIVLHDSDYFIHVRAILLVYIKNNHEPLKEYVSKSDDNGITVTQVLQATLQEIEDDGYFPECINRLLVGDQFAQAKSLLPLERQQAFKELFTLVISL